jgi:hypothetical protein
MAIYGNIRFADLNEDGRPDAVGTQDGYSLDILLNATTSPTGVLARAFTPTKVIPIVESSRLLDIHIEPVGGTFAAADIDPSSLRLLSEGTGSVSSIAAVVDKGTIGDTDHNGVAELAAAFRMDDVAALFDGIHGKADVPVRIQGSLADGRRLCAPLTLPILGAGGSLAARVEPNPINPQGTLRFALDHKAEVTVRIFDATGRMVRTVWERRATEAGLVEVPVDGRTSAGTAMASGVYFYQIEVGGERSRGRFAILK